MQYDVIIVGGGLSGLACAVQLKDAGLSFLLLDASDRVGGRVRTDSVNGFLLDHGFQVLQTAYPESQRQLNYSELALKFYAPGAIVRAHQRFHVLAHPLRSPKQLVSTITAPIGTFADRLRMLRLGINASWGPLERLFKEDETTTMEFLKAGGFSEDFIDRFFVPFFGGVCLDTGLQASSRVFKYVFRMFARGEAAIPARGMEEIPKQLADRLPADTIQTNARVTHIEGSTVHLENGHTCTARRVVLATEAPEISRLLGLPDVPRSYGEICLYFSLNRAPIDSPFLVLNGDNEGIINNITFPSLVSNRYAPAGKILMSVVVLGNGNRLETDLLNAVRQQLVQWFGPEARLWRHLKTQFIRHALPDQRPPTANPFRSPLLPMPGVFVCGEYDRLPGIQWALNSGRQAGLAVIHDLV